MITKSSGFTLIELLVVVAIIGIIAAIGVVSYQGYVASAKIKSAKNVLMQAGLGQICLLYTSPSPRDLSTSRMPSSA